MSKRLRGPTHGISSLLQLSSDDLSNSDDVPKKSRLISPHIELILGPMFAGKSTELLRRVRRYSNANQKCLVIKYKKDTRYGPAESFSTHDRQTLDAIPCEMLMPQLEEALKHDVIGVDEGQFFPDIVEFCELMASKKKVVVVSALDGTFQRKPFGNVLQLIPLAEQVEKLTAVCKICFRDAAFTKRLGSETQVEVIGGAEMYLPVCRECFHLEGVPPTPTSNVDDAMECAEKQQEGDQQQQQQQQQDPIVEAKQQEAIAAAAAAAGSNEDVILQ